MARPAPVVATRNTQDREQIRLLSRKSSLRHGWHIPWSGACLCLPKPFSPRPKPGRTWILTVHSLRLYTLSKHVFGDCLVARRSLRCHPFRHALRSLAVGNTGQAPRCCDLRKPKISLSGRGILSVVADPAGEAGRRKTENGLCLNDALRCFAREILCGGIGFRQARCRRPSRDFGRFLVVKGDIVERRTVD